MRIWIVGFGILFALAEFYQWVKDYISPLPIYVLGGAFLAIASNYEKGICSFGESKQKSTALNGDENCDRALEPENKT
ncbi:MAG: hypothetical protein ACFBSE_26370 [Prochloraceae cyanobacterium]